VECDKGSHVCVSADLSHPLPGTRCTSSRTRLVSCSLSNQVTNRLSVQATQLRCFALLRLSILQRESVLLTHHTVCCEPGCRAEASDTGWLHQGVLLKPGFVVHICLRVLWTGWLAPPAEPGSTQHEAGLRSAPAHAAEDWQRHTACVRALIARVDVCNMMVETSDNGCSCDCAHHGQLADKCVESMDVSNSSAVGH
jgi:hypothetical protein